MSLRTPSAGSVTSVGGDTNLVQVQCDSFHQCEQIISRRKAFSRVDPTPHQSAAVQRLLRNKLYVDNYCTKEQLRIRHSK
jgi:hypothetical protein